jgi:fatty acid desaturase
LNLPSSNQIPPVGVPARVEWPTVAVAAGVYGGLGAVLILHARLGAPGTVVALSVLGCWFMSLQHECIHGHPFPSRRLNGLLAALPLNPAVPYAMYRETHLLHHRNALLTEPTTDPESHYTSGGRWDQLGAAGRFLLTANQTLVGRLVVHPVRALLRTLALLPSEFRDSAKRRMWTTHMAGSLLVVVAVQGVAHVSMWQYLLGFCYGGAALTAVRGYAEHRWCPPGQSRSATVDAGLAWRLLFLNNNFHHAHHADPSLPWFQVPAQSRHLDAAVISARGAGSYSGYGEIFWRYAFRPLVPVVHPEYPARCCLVFPACACAPGVGTMRAP